MVGVGNDNFTTKAIYILNSAVSVAKEYQHQQLREEHIAKALIEDSDKIAKRILEYCNVDVNKLLGDIHVIIKKIPVVSGSGAGDVTMSNSAKKVLESAAQLAKRNKESIHYNRAIISGSYFTK